MKKLFVVRHGYQEKHALTDHGIRQMKWVIEEIRRRFSGAKIVVVAADTSHVKESAAMITGELGLEEAVITDLLCPESLDRAEAEQLIRELRRVGESTDVLLVVARTGLHMVIGHWLDTTNNAFDAETKEDRKRSRSDRNIFDTYGCGYVLDYERGTCEAVHNEVKW